MDVDASRALADSVAAWSGLGEAIRVAVTEAEALSEILTGVVAMIDEVGGDGAAMATAIRRAADALSSFSIQLESPRSIAAAVAAVHRFRGSENDPELDRRVRTLRGLVDASTESDDQAAHVMALLLASNQSVHVGGRSVDDVASAMALVQRLNQAEAGGAISGNDTRIDAAVGALRTALADHAASDDQLDQLVAAFLADRNRTAAPTLLASVITGQSPTVVEFAHTRGLDYDIAAGLLSLQKIDRLTSAMQTAPPPEADELRRERFALFASVSGVTDRATLDQFARRSDQGVPAIEVIPAVMADQIRAAEVDVVIEEMGLDLPAASLQLDYMLALTGTLVESGWLIDDAAVAVAVAAKAGRDIGPIVELAVKEGTTLIAATNKLNRVDELQMDVGEFDALEGLIEFFDVFDAATGTAADQLVSLADLRFVVNNYDQFSEAAALAAWAFLASIDLRNRLDSAAQTGDVVSHDRFGADRPADNKYSIADIALLITKQETNFDLRNVVDQIDAAGTGGGPGWVDNNLSEADFEHVLANQVDYGLTTVEVTAIELVLKADWYDPTVWQEHSGSLILATAVVAGIAAGVATAGAAGPVSGVLISAMAGATAGAATGAGLTAAENLLTGDPLTQDLAENTVLGAMGGVAGAGFQGAITSLTEGSLAVRVVGALGFQADVAGLASAGLFDPLLDPLIDDIEIDSMHGDFQTVNYLLGGVSVAGGAAALTGEATHELVVRAGSFGLDELAAVQERD